MQNKQLTDAEKITCLEIAMKTEKGKYQVQRAADVSGQHENIAAELKLIYDQSRVV